MSTYKELKIKSNIQDYSVMFVDDFSKALTKESLEKSFFIIDQNVFNLYKKKIQKMFNHDRYLIVEATEVNKTLGYIKYVVKFLINKNIKRNNKIIAIGGGIIQDIAGFVSSIA